MPSLVPFDEARDKRFNELMDVRRTQHGRVLGSQTNFLKARAQNIQEELANERFAIQRQTLELSRTKELTQMLKQRAAIEMQVQTQQHTVKALETLGKLDPSMPDYHLKLAEVFHDNPLAAKDPLIQDIVKSQITARHVQETTAAEITRHEEAQISEFERMHGVKAVRDPNTNRADWPASQAAADAAMKERNRALTEGMGSPTETKVEDGKLKQTFRDIPTSVREKFADLTGEIEKHTTASKEWKQKMADFNTLSDEDKTSRAKELQQWDKNRITSEASASAAQSKRNALLQQFPQLIPSAPKTSSTGDSEFTDPEHVKNEYKAGRLTRDQAVSVLKDQFGHTD